MNNNKFGGNREKAIVRDGNKCLKCRMTREQHKLKYNRDITVDHKDGNGSGMPTKKQNNRLSNLQTLCLSCHARKDRLRAIFERTKQSDITKLQLIEAIELYLEFFEKSSKFVESLNYKNRKNRKDWVYEILHLRLIEKKTLDEVAETKRTYPMRVHEIDFWFRRYATSKLGYKLFSEKEGRIGLIGVEK